MFLLFFLSVFSSYAQSSDQIEKLASDPHWNSLVHYRPSWGGLKSEIRSADFFLSPNGRNDPTAELIATIKAMRSPVDQDPDAHAQCRFPARFLWLKANITDKSLTWPNVICPKFLEFSFRGDIESISLLFATGYLSNPASYFGHPLIKFNLSLSKTTSSLLDVSINYGAVTPPKENAFIYAFKGLFGGYKATFTHRQFHYNNHMYGEIELRDMWEYRLNLKANEVQHIYAHIWEVIGKEFPYYFFSENCASAAAQIIGDVVNVDLMPKYLPYSLPYTLFNNLIEKKRPDGTPLVSSVELIPSRQSRLIARFEALDSESKMAVASVAGKNEVTNSLSSLPPEKRVKAIEALFDYYSFRSVKDRPQREEVNPFAAVKHELLVDRLQLPASTVQEPISYKLEPPHRGPRPLMTRLGGISNSKFGAGAELQLRSVYYDFLSLDLGRPANSEIRATDLTLDFVDNTILLRKFDLISISTLNISKTGLPGDGGWAWQFEMGLDSQNLACRECTLFKIEAGYGKAFPLFDRHVFFTMLDVRAQTLSAGSGVLGATPTAGMLINWHRSGLLKTELKIGYRSYLERDDADAMILKTETSLNIDRDWDIRVLYQQHVAEMYTVSVARYW